MKVKIIKCSLFKVAQYICRRVLLSYFIASKYSNSFNSKSSYSCFSSFSVSLIFFIIVICFCLLLIFSSGEIFKTLLEELNPEYICILSSILFSFFEIKLFVFLLFAICLIFKISERRINFLTGVFFCGGFKNF